MVRILGKWWRSLSDYGIPAGTTPDERKLYVSTNQLMVSTLLLIAIVLGTLAVAWLFLISVDYNFYFGHFWGGVPVAVSLAIGIGIFIYRGKTRQFFGPIVFFAYLMTVLTTVATIVFGNDFGLEFWLISIMGISVFVLHKRPAMRRVTIGLLLANFVGLRVYVHYATALLPVPHAETRMLFILIIAAAIFIIMFLEFRFITMQSAKAEEAFVEQRNVADRLLLNIMPQSVADELKLKGRYEPRHYDSVTVLFTDFVGFTGLAARLSPQDLLASLEDCFNEFDVVVQREGLEKLKTIGDSYMCAAGIPEWQADHAARACRAALAFRQIIAENRAKAETRGTEYWNIRIGLHTGPVVAGIIGEHKFAYDIWGDTVNIASRMESSGEVGRINMSAATVAAAGAAFQTRSRGLQQAKGLGEIEMFELVDLVALS